MRTFVSIGLGITLAMAIFCSSATATTPMVSVDKTSRSVARIVNGLLSHEHYTTGMLVDSANINGAALICTGTMIGCDTFLTAAHCVENSTNPNNYGVFLQHAGVLAVSSVAIHPNYNFPVADVAVLKLSTPVTGIAPTAINTTQSPAFGTTGLIAGYGRTSGSNDESGLKHYGNVSTANCSSAGESNTTSVCWNFSNPLGGSGTNSNTCNGDSGGPLFIDFGSGPVVAGVTSGGGSQDCMPNDASFDTNVYNYRNWIQQQAGSDINNTSCGSLPQLGESNADVFGASGILNSSNREASHTFQVSPGTSELRVSMNAIDDFGASNYDLYVRAGTPATTSNFDCKSDGNGQLGFCDFSNPQDGTWYLLVDRRSGSGTYQVTAATFGGACQDGDPCDDGNSCTSGDTCSSGACGGTPVANGTSCNDGNSCTQPDTCQAGVCSGGGPTCGDGIVQSCEVCDDGNSINGDGCENDCTLSEQHDSVITAVKPLTIKIAPERSSVTKKVRVRVINADLDGSANNITALASDGNCPSGTVGDVDFRGSSTATIASGRNTRGTLFVTANASAFDTLSAKSPTRCTAHITVSATGGDPTPENNSVPLVIDVIDRNDF